MAKAVELPDPLDKPPLGPNPNADELLAQMAGEEIDRLLKQAEHQERAAAVAAKPLTPSTQDTVAAEAELALDTVGQTPVAVESRVDSVTPSAPPATESIVSPPPPLPADVADPQLAAQFNELFEELNRSASPDAVEGGPPVAAAITSAPLRSAESPAAEAAPTTDVKSDPPAVAEHDAALARQLDTLLENLTPSEPAPAQTEAPPAPTEPAPLQTEASAAPMRPPPSLATALPAPIAASAAPAKSPKEPVASEPATQVAADEAAAPDQSGPVEPQVLAARALQEVAAQVSAGAEASVGGASRRSPLYIRVLELLNAPMADCSDATRDLAGKVAIMTLVLAMAVLIWVTFFAPQ